MLTAVIDDVKKMRKDKHRGVLSVKIKQIEKEIERQEKNTGNDEAYG
jgi:hypothetical protein